MHPEIETIEQAEDFIKNLKRSDNWVSDDHLHQCLEHSEELIRAHKREDLLPYVGVNFCLYHLDHSSLEKAWQYAEIAAHYGEIYSNFECLLSGLSLQYRIQRHWGNLDKAQEIINQQIDIALKYKDPHQIASAYHNQGMIYHRQRLKKDCYEAYEKSLKYITLSGKDYYIANFHIGYASVLLDFNEHEKAEPYLKKGFELAKERQFLLPLAIAYSNYGMLYQLQKKEAACVDAFINCIILFEQQKNNSDAIMAKIMLADAHVSFDNLNEAEHLLHETIIFSEKHQLKYNLIGIYDALSNLMEKKGDYPQSLHYLRKLMQAKEEYLNAESEKRIQSLETLQKLNILNMEKQNAEQMANIKHEFLANMSHEIRTPINSILGICYLLEQQPLNAGQKDYVHRLKRSGENLLGIVNDVLDISKIESGKMELTEEPFSISVILQDVYQSQELKALDKGLDFQVPLPDIMEYSLLGDSVRLYQVLLNLTSNAIKFTTEGSVQLTTQVNPGIGKRTELIFQIKDTGIGIPQDKLNRIFERYEQANATIKNTFGGTGLGLSISRKIIELMQGSIEVQSTLNEGTTFTVRLSFKQRDISSEEIITTMLQPAHLAGKTILIADDHKENRLIAREILLNFQPNLKIIEAEHGKQVLDILELTIPDILFIDLDMPLLNGIETTAAIRKEKRFSDIKIIGNSASLLSINKEEMLELGFDEFLFKPYKAAYLITTIHKMLH